MSLVTNGREVLFPESPIFVDLSSSYRPRLRAFLFQRIPAFVWEENFVYFSFFPWFVFNFVTYIEGENLTGFLIV